MFWFKGCTRCGGDLYTAQDMCGPYVSCLQCGRELPPEQAHALLQRHPVGQRSALEAPSPNKAAQAA